MSLEEMLADLPHACDRGTKTNSKGYKESWNGYKLHIDVADGQIPISCFLTSASCHDSQVAIPLATMTATRVTNLYDLMDSAYDCQHTAAHSIGLGHVPIIGPNRRNGKPRERAPAQKIRYQERTGVERVNGRLKNEFGERVVRVRGATKIMAHLGKSILFSLDVWHSCPGRRPDIAPRDVKRALPSLKIVGKYAPHRETRQTYAQKCSLRKEIQLRRKILASERGTERKKEDPRTPDILPIHSTKYFCTRLR